ncbi:MAG: MogA/MoaB family molybdenum cofactor biosynthesis protein [Desulfuromonadales bacterium]|nr:MogA/MoaB family molybdenum cofactor biosynthesis protein [Desulfuromonadales bacterium]
MKFRIGILTLSDKGARGERVDGSGPLLATLVAELGEVVKAAIIPDDAATISATLCAWADKEDLQLILTTGGTGLSPRDVTPEATLQVVDRLVPGMAEAMRAASLVKTPHAMLSRAVVGIRGATLIINLPGSPKGASENLAVLLPALGHALAKLQGDPADCATP